MPYRLTIPVSKARPLIQAARIPPLVALSQQLSAIFSSTTLLLIGAFLLIPAARHSYVLLPAFLVLGTKLVDALVVHFRIKPNPYLADVYHGRNTAIVPGENGIVNEKNPAAQKGAVLMLGAKSNHPFGLLAPAVVETFGWMRKTNDQFDSAFPRQGLPRSDELGKER